MFHLLYNIKNEREYGEHLSNNNPVTTKIIAGMINSELLSGHSVSYVPPVTRPLYNVVNTVLRKSDDLQVLYKFRGSTNLNNLRTVKKIDTLYQIL